MGRKLTNPPSVQKYFGGKAYITEDFHPDGGWRAYPPGIRMSPSMVHRLRKEGIESVALVPVSDPDRDPADFQMEKLIEGLAPKGES